jgi:hypothetical protein
MMAKRCARHNGSYGGNTLYQSRALWLRQQAIAKVMELLRRGNRCKNSGFQRSRFGKNTVVAARGTQKAGLEGVSPAFRF